MQLKSIWQTPLISAHSLLETVQNPKKKASNLTFFDLISLSNRFNACHPFPTQNNRISQVAINKELEDKIVDFATQTYPLFPKSALFILENFLTVKQERGNKIEQAIYFGMTIEDFIDRLLVKRPITFYTEKDFAILRRTSKENPLCKGYGNFDAIGTENEKDPLLLKDYLSYEEMELAALLGISSPTFFINSGSRANKAQMQPLNTFENEGIYVGLVGARFERQERMDWKHIIITPSQNTSQNGYGEEADINSTKYQLLKGFAKAYKQGNLEKAFFPTYQEALKNKDNFFELPKVLNASKTAFETPLFNIRAYKERIRLVLQSYLLEANKRAQDLNKKAYVHLVGLGLGVWQIDFRQKQLFVDVVSEILHTNRFQNISALDFSWFDNCFYQNQPVLNKPVSFQDKDKEGNLIKIYFSKRDPAQKLDFEHQEDLLVAAYAWDSNSMPGNEYWNGILDGSGDPAAICCSLVGELQNPEINPLYVSGYNCKFR